MDTRLDRVTLKVGADSVSGTLLAPDPRIPGVLFVHGWGGSQRHDLVRAREAAGLGCLCLTFDLRGHEADAAQQGTVSRAQNLDDLLAAYDWLCSEGGADPESMAVVGISYGGYLAAILSELRPVRWLALRSPALYMDADWNKPKRQLHADSNLGAYRRQLLEPGENRALRASAAFRGDALLVAAEHDETVPRQTMENYRTAFSNANSITMRTLAGADHALSGKPMQRAYTNVLVAWLTEMLVGARGNAAKAKVAEYQASHGAANEGDRRPG